ncbi:MAG: hemolysin, partial [Flavobacteriales bacterium]|nr:hemolysin [Flavobacteriales bacterium]
HEIDYLNDKFKLELPEGEAYDTLGGLILHLREDIPEENDIIVHENFRFEITEAADTRIGVVKVSITNE